MKEEIIQKLKDKYEALDLIQINDLLNLNTPEELNLLSKTLEELTEGYIIYKTKKEICRTRATSKE